MFEYVHIYTGGRGCLQPTLKSYKAFQACQILEHPLEKLCKTFQAFQACQSLYSFTAKSKLFRACIATKKTQQSLAVFPSSVRLYKPLQISIGGMAEPLL